MISSRSENKVILRARPLAAGFSRFDISHRMSSTRTADNAIVVEKVIAATRLNVTFRNGSHPRWLERRESRLNNGMFKSFCDIDEERCGMTFCQTAVATTRNVKANGADERAMVEGGKESSLRWR